MSIGAIVSAYRLDLPPVQKFVLVTMADNADDTGGNVFPSIYTLCEKTGYSRRTVQKAISDLVRCGALINEGTSKFGTALYRISCVGIPEYPKVSRQKSCPRPLRQELILRFSQMCQYCRRTGDEGKGPDGHHWCVDRIIPGSRGGNYTPDNITLSCRSCNSRKKDKAAAPLFSGMLSLESARGARSAPPLGVHATQARGAPSAPKPLVNPKTLTSPDSNESVEVVGGNNIRSFPVPVKDLSEAIFKTEPGTCLFYMVARGYSDRQSRGLLGKWRRQIGDAALVEIMGAASRKQVENVVEYMSGAVRARKARTAKAERDHVSVL